MHYHPGGGRPFINHNALLLFNSSYFLETQVRVSLTWAKLLVRLLQSRRMYCCLWIVQRRLGARATLPLTGEVRGGVVLSKSQESSASFARTSRSLPNVHFLENAAGSWDRDTLQLFLTSLFKSLKRKRKKRAFSIFQVLKVARN